MRAIPGGTLGRMTVRRTDALSAALRRSRWHTFSCGTGTKELIVCPVGKTWTEEMVFLLSR